MRFRVRPLRTARPRSSIEAESGRPEGVADFTARPVRVRDEPAVLAKSVATGGEASEAGRRRRPAISCS